MENIVDLIAADASPSDISDAIKTALFAKSAENIEMIKPEVAASLFGQNIEYHEDSEE
jgi:hypothetical protein